MSGFLQKLKRKPLLEELQERFPKENIEPYGQVFVAPLNAVSKHDEESLKKQGCKVLYQSWKGQTCAFIQPSNSQSESNQASQATEKEKATEETPVTEAEPRTDRRADRHLQPRWTVDERKLLQELLAQGLPLKTIADKMGRSVFSIGAQIRHLPDARKYLRTTRKDERKKPQVSSTQEPEQVKPKVEDPDIIKDVKELLEAALLLIDSGKKKATKIVLSEANRILENRRHED
jgi:hypothetical protein